MRYLPSSTFFSPNTEEVMEEGGRGVEHRLATEPAEPRGGGTPKCLKKGISTAWEKYFCGKVRKATGGAFKLSRVLVRATRVAVSLCLTRLLTFSDAELHGWLSGYGEQGHLVRMDFSMTAESRETIDFHSEQLLDVTIADKQMMCILPPSSVVGAEFCDALDQATAAQLSLCSKPFPPWLMPSPDSRWEVPLTNLSANAYRRPFFDAWPNEKIRNLLNAADASAAMEDSWSDANFSLLTRHWADGRVSWLNGRCYLVSKPSDPTLPYEVCIGKSIMQKPRRNSKKGYSVDWGNHVPRHDKISPNGAVTQAYSTASGDRISVLRMECGDTRAKVSVINEMTPGHFLLVVLQAPFFCDFSPSARHPVPLETQLCNLDGWCSTYSSFDGFTYEFCYPDSLIRYKEVDGTPKALTLLGTLYLSRPRTTPTGLHTSGDNIQLQTPLRRTGKLPEGLNYKNLPLEIVDMPPALHFRVIPAHQALALHLGQGSKCPGSQGTHSARVLFVCPGKIDTRLYSSIIGVHRVSSCHHDIVVRTEIVCAHPRLLPLKHLPTKMTYCYPRKTRVAPLADIVSPRPEAIGLGQSSHAYLSNVYGSLEAVPEVLEKSERLAGFFGLSNVERSRAGHHEPHYRIGEIVRHRWWGYIGVVVAWDESCRAPPHWEHKVFQEYPFAYKILPHYLVAVSSDVEREFSPAFSFTYVPEPGLLPVKGTVKIESAYLDNLFAQYDEDLQRFVPFEGSRLQQEFGCDFPLNFQFPSVHDFQEQKDEGGSSASTRGSETDAGTRGTAAPLDGVNSPQFTDEGKLAGETAKRFASKGVRDEL